MKKGQAALEFLMTYGWAILVVLAAVGALAYFGVLSPGKFLPEKCITTNPAISCAGGKAVINPEANNSIVYTLHLSSGYSTLTFDATASTFATKLDGCTNLALRAGKGNYTGLNAAPGTGSATLNGDDDVTVVMTGCTGVTGVDKIRKEFTIAPINAQSGLPEAVSVIIDLKGQ